MREDTGVAHLDRLSALDAAFLDLETPRAPLHVGWTMGFEGDPPSVAALRRHLDARLDHVPRFRRRLARVPGGLAWVDDPGFDIARHVDVVALRAPGGPGELRDLAGVLLSRPLELGRPLWRLYLVEGVRGGFGVVGQAHHALVDGIAAIEVAMLLFDAEASPPPAAAAGPRVAWRPAPEPRAAAAVRDAAGSGLLGGMRALGAVGRAAAAPGATARAAREAGVSLASVLGPAPATRLDRSATARRTLGFAGAPLAGVREAGRRRGATVNDVLLAAATLALGRALRRHGERPATLKALVPVNVRDREAGTGTLGNAISFLPVALPVAEPDPTTVLRTVRDRTRTAKGGGGARPLALLARAGDLLPASGRRAVARTAARVAPFNAVVSNVPGPPGDLFLLGRRLATLHPAVPLLEGHAVSVGAISYGERLHVGLLADAEVVPDVVEIARDLESAFDALRLAPAGPGAATTPWRARARARRAARA